MNRIIALESKPAEQGEPINRPAAAQLFNKEVRMSTPVILARQLRISMSRRFVFAALLVVSLGVTASLALAYDGPAVEPPLDATGKERLASLTDNLTASHSLHVLLTDPSRPEHEAFFIQNRALISSGLQMEAYDQQGKLLAIQNIITDTYQARFAWNDLPSGTASLILSLDVGAINGLRVSTPRGSSLLFAELAARKFRIPATASSIILYNPSESTVDVETHGDKLELLTLLPHELRTITLTTGEGGAWISATEKIVALSPQISSNLSFSDPEIVINMIQGYGEQHCGIDVGSGEMSLVLSSAYGMTERAAIIGNSEPIQPQCDRKYAGLANMVLIKHVLTNGERIWSRYLHLYPSNPNGLLPTDSTAGAARIVKGQVVGLEGRTGWACGYHLHYETDTSISADSFGAVDGSCESQYSTRSTNPSPYRAGGSARILLPLISNQANPTSANYQVFATAGAPTYGSLPLQPSSEKTFRNVGIGGVVYGTATVANLFTVPATTLSPTSAPLTGQGTFAAGDYALFANNDDGTDGFGRGYEVKFSVLPLGGEIVDNDGVYVDASGDTSTVNRQGYFSAMAVNALDVPGYFLSAKLLSGGTSNWARWFPQNSATYEVYVHVPKGSTATSVVYKIFLKGRPADGVCSPTNSTYPCYQTDPVSHATATNQDAWTRLTAANGSITQFTFVTSGVNSAYVGLSLQDVAAGAYAGVDAVKFVVGPSVTSFNVNSGASSTTSRTVTLNNVATGSPTHYMASESASFSGAAWQIYATAPSFLLSSGNTTKTVYLKVKNATSESPAKSDSITLNEATAPSVTSFSINSDASSTTSRIVTLNNVATGSPTHYMASESVSFSGASWQTYATAPNFTLTSGNTSKTVYFKIKNAVGESPAKSDVISLNEVVAPTLGAFSISGDAASTTTRSVTLTNTASGSPTHYMASEAASFSGAAWQTYATAPSFTLTSGNATKTVYFKIKNTAGESAVRNDSIILNAPLTYTSAPSAGLYTSGGSVLKLKVTLSGSQATFTVAKQDGSAFSTSGTMTLRSGAINGCVANSNTYYWSFSAGPTTTSKTFDLANYSGFLSGTTKDFYAAIGKPSTYCDGTAPLYYSGRLSITAQ